jgi:hypothetical protein
LTLNDLDAIIRATNQNTHIDMHTPILSAERRLRVLTVGVCASIALYVLLAFVAEPIRSLAATATDDVEVQLTINEALSLGCDGTDANTVFDTTEPVSLGSITYSGDTGAPTFTAMDKSAWCYVKTNNTAGYTLGWHIASGSGGTRTGYLISQFEDYIAPFGAGSGNATATWSVTATDARWGGRVSSTSSGSQTGPYQFGTDGGSEKWARVKTGATVAIRRSVAESQHGSGDLIKIGFRAQVGTTITQPAGLYKKASLRLFTPVIWRVFFDMHGEELICIFYVKVV